MKTMRLFFATSICILILSNQAFAQKSKFSYNESWKEIEQLKNEGKTTSAFSLTETILNRAKKDKNSEQWIKALIHKMYFRSLKDEDALEISIKEMEEEIRTSSQPTTSILHSAIAEMYWWYYQNQRWNLSQRTNTEEEATDDIATWTIKNFVEKVNYHYEMSLDEAIILTENEPADMELIWEKGKNSRNLRPTLYDVLIHRALNFYSHGHSGLSAPRDQFYIDQPSYFSPAEEFVDLSIKEPEYISFEYKALQLYRTIISFHLVSENIDALVYNELERLKYVYSKYSGENKDSLYEKSLIALETKYSENEYSSDVAFQRAQFYSNKGSRYNSVNSPKDRWKIKEAIELCSKTITSYPKSRGALLCEQLKTSLEEPGFSIQMENVVSVNGKITTNIRYKNIKKLYFRIVGNHENILPKGQSIKASNDIQYFLDKKVLREWSVDLIDSGDYQFHSMEFENEGLSKGYYALLSSTNPSFKTSDNRLSSNLFWSSSLAYFFNQEKGGGAKLFTLNRSTGKPIKGVNVNLYEEKYNHQKRNTELHEIAVFVSDAEGKVLIPVGDNNKNYKVLLRNGTDSLFISQPIYVSNNKSHHRAYLRTAIFTDRAIYRPGQRLYFKGILLEYEEFNVKNVNGKELTIKLFDRNNQEVSRLDLTTTEYGTFHGSFTLPSSALTGTFYLDDGLTGVRQRVSIEEYKRPSFEVEIDDLLDNVKLGDDVTIIGSAKSLNGVALTGAKGKYHIVRKSMGITPYFYIWPYPTSPSAEIDKGTFETDNEGNFEITFQAVPDKKLSKKFQPIFQFEIDVMVSDVNNESQSTKKSLPIGYHTLKLDAKINEEVNRKDLDSILVSSSNLMGSATPTKIDVEVLELILPKKPIKQRLWDVPDYISPDSKIEKFNPNRSLLDQLDVGDPFLSKQVNTENSNHLDLSELGELPGKAFMLKLKSTDPFGQEVFLSKRFLVYDETSKTLPMPSVFWSKLLTNEVEVGNEATIVFGSSYKNAMAYYSVSNKHGLKKESWLTMDGNKQSLSFNVDEKDKGILAFQIMLIYEGRLYVDRHNISIPAKEKELDIHLETFRKDLKPGDKETWKVTVKDFEGKGIEAEILASMYDKSLDQIRKHQWNFSPYYWSVPHRFYFTGNNFQSSRSRYYPFFERKRISIPQITFDRLNWFGLDNQSSHMGGMYKSANLMSDGIETAAANGKVQRTELGKKSDDRDENIESSPEVNNKPVYRSDFRETAFFYPELKTTKNGESEFSFEVPDALTKWNLQLLAHTKDLKYGLITEDFVTKKEVMVVPNYPRFIYSGDTLLFSCKVSNLSDEVMDLEVSIAVSDAFTGKLLSNSVMGKIRKTIMVEPGINQTVNWKVIGPSDPGIVEIAVFANGESHSDGEMRRIPVLSNSILITESYPISIDGGQKKKVVVKNLGDDAEGIKAERLTVEFTANPIWYVVQALPYLADLGNESNGQLFNRYYANSLAFHITQQNDKIQKVFELWSQTSPETFSSKLEQNAELKNIVLAETPWLLNAKNEEEDKKKIANFFDQNNLKNDLSNTLFELFQAQTPNGGWPWFKGMEDNRFITQQIVLGMGRLSNLGIKDIRQDQLIYNSIQRAVEYMDARIDEDYRQILAHNKNIEKDFIGAHHIQYLFARSYFTEMVINDKHKEAHDYFKGQAKKYWLPQVKYLQAMIALSFNRFGDKEFANQILTSLKENAIDHEEFGTYWKKESGYYWYQANIEKQAMIIEAFDEITGDEVMVNSMKKWLLKQKQTRLWPTGKASAEACYAMLLRGSDLLTEDNTIQLSVGSESYRIPSAETKSDVGSGYSKMAWEGNEIKPEMNNIVAENSGNSVVWGAAYFQFFQSADQVEQSGTAFSIERELYVKRYNNTGPILVKLESGKRIETGEIVVVKMIIKSDRDLEFVHLKDMKAAGLEPVQNVSGYRYAGGIGHYFSIRDASTNFYFGKMARGTYVLEYELKANNSGSFTTGISTIQSFYAPEFSAHSSGGRIVIK